MTTFSENLKKMMGWCPNAAFVLKIVSSGFSLARFMGLNPHHGLRAKGSIEFFPVKNSSFGCECHKSD